MIIVLAVIVLYALCFFIVANAVYIMWWWGEGEPQKYRDLKETGSEKEKADAEHERIAWAIGLGIVWPAAVVVYGIAVVCVVLGKVALYPGKRWFK